MNRNTWLIAAALLSLAALEFAALGPGAFGTRAATASGDETPIAISTVAPPASLTPTPITEAATPAPDAPASDPTADETPSPESAAAVASGNITGFVKDALGTPIAGAFAIASGDGICCFGASTAADGSYTIVDLPPGPYRVFANASGYAGAYYDGVYDRDDATLVVVPGGGVASGVDFGLEVGVSISGTVTDALGTPIAGVYISAESNSICCPAAVTDESGLYTIPDLSPGDYVLRASAPGYAAEYYDNVYAYNDATPITIAIDSSATDINFVLAAGETISGTVTDELGTPIAGAQLYAGSTTCCGYGYATSGADGAYLIENLAPGDYIVQVSAAGYAGEYYDNIYSYGATTPVTVPATGINFALAPGATISGVVKDAFGTPIAGAYIYVNGDTLCCAGATTAADGSYTVSNLAPGDYLVQAQAEGYADEYYDNTSDYTQATHVILSTGSTATGVDFSLDAAASISGVITDAFGTPIAGAQVYAWSDACCDSGGATTAGDGSYLIPNLTPGSYLVQASAFGFVAAYYDGVDEYGDATLVPTTTGNTTIGINFTLAAAARISGTITNALGTPITGAHVYASTDECCSYSDTTSGAGGIYLIDGLATGPHRVYASAPGYVYSYYDGTRNYEDATLVIVTSGETATGIDFHLETAARISGKITDALGAPLVGASVYADPFDCCGNTEGASTAADGTYLLDELIPGSYRVHAQGPYCAPGDACIDYAAEYYENVYDSTLATAVAAASDITTTDIDFALAEGGIITGTILDPLGTPVANAYVNSNRVECCGSGFATTGEDGTYTITGLPPGDEIVSARADCQATSPPPAQPCTPYPRWYYANACEESNAVPVAVASGVPTSNIDVTLKAANPDCLEHAVRITDLPFTDTRSSAGATTAPGEPVPCGSNSSATEWYVYAPEFPPSPPSSATTISVDTVGSGYDTALAVYNGGITPAGVLSLVDCDANGSDSFVKFTAEPGTVYFIQVAGQEGATGQLQLNVSPDTDGDGYTDLEETRLGEDPDSFCIIMRADVDGDGDVSVLDLSAVGAHFLEPVTPSLARFDQDADGIFSIFDLALMSKAFTQQASDCDGAVTAT